MIWFFLIVLAIGLGVFTTWRLRSAGADPYATAEANRPSDLAGARVVESCTRLAMSAPFALHGVPDVIYAMPDGSLKLREDKSGFAHPFSDRIEISVYGAILRHNPPASLRGSPVQEYGYIRYGIPGKTRVRWQRVKLFTDAELVTLIARHRALRTGTTPAKTSDMGYCVKVCPHYKVRCAGSK